MIPKNVKSVISEFRDSRGQSTRVPVKSNQKVSSTSRDKHNQSYESFLRKYYDLENSIDDFSTRDLVYYFREIATESGYRYTISNIKKDMSIMKRLRDNYTSREICAMIEFMYISNQDYLDKNRLSPNILASQWVNTVFADTKLWADDKYSPKKSKNFVSKGNSRHEWDKNESGVSNSTKIGVKL